MRVLISNSTGHGAIIGSRLIMTGSDVTFLDATRRAASLDRTPLTVNSPLGNFKRKVLPFEGAELQSEFHLVIVTNPADELPDLADILDRGARRGTIILSLADGLDHVGLLEQGCPVATALDGASRVARCGNTCKPRTSIPYRTKFCGVRLGVPDAAEVE